MSIYSGFGTSKQETFHNNLLSRPIVIFRMMEQMAARIEYDQTKYEGLWAHKKQNHSLEHRDKDTNHSDLYYNTGYTSGAQINSNAEYQWNEKFYKNFKMLRSMEKAKHLDPKFSTAVERLVRRLIKRSPGTSMSKKSKRTAHLMREDDEITETKVELENRLDNTLSQDKTEYIVHQVDHREEGDDRSTQMHLENDIDNHSKSQFLVDDSYNLKSNSHERPNRKRRRSSIQKSAQMNFQLIEKAKLLKPKVNKEERKEMISVLKNNSKALTQQEKSLEKRAQRGRKDALIKVSKPRGQLNNYKHNESEAMKINDSGTKEYTDGRYAKKPLKSIKSRGQERLRTKEKNNGSIHKKSYTSLHNSLSETTEGNKTEAAAGQYSITRSHKSNTNLVSGSRKRENEEYVNEVFPRIDFVRPKTSKIDGLEGHKQKDQAPNDAASKEDAIENNYNLFLKNKRTMNIKRNEDSKHEYGHNQFNKSCSSMAKYDQNNFPDNESVLAASTRLTNKDIKNFNSQNNAEQLEDNYANRGDRHRRIVSNKLNNDNHRHISRRMAPMNRLSTSLKSIKRKRRKRPPFNLNLSTTTSRKTRSKGHLSALSRKIRSLKKKRNAF
ncbi:unnamed protein product [Moneuplotes crassus]|uniref:Uncharacterized protein n=1 Tax=Euplotes crassus TaxID=5936 RepID=A0AAD1Y7I0_EUPCR|nr:unnamed protein product [Moneuplotes crassus]